MAFSVDEILTYQYSKESLISTFSVVPEFGFALSFGLPENTSTRTYRNYCEIHQFIEDLTRRLKDMNFIFEW